MFRKLNLKTLVIILAVLVAIYLIATMVGGNDRTFRSEIVNVDTANVTDIYISILKDKAEINLKKTGGSDNWEVSSAGNNFVADPNIVKNILAQFSEMKPERIAATSKDKWAQFEVSDSTGTHVILKDGNSELANVWIGKFSYSQPPAQAQQQNPYQQQQRGKMTSFIRVNKEDEVYAVEGFLKMTYQKDINSFRQKSLVNVNKDDLTRLVFNYPGFSTFTLTKNDTKWMINGVMADSAKTVKYLTKIAKLSSSDFLPASTSKTSEATYKLTVEGNNFSPVEIKAFPAADTLVKFVVTSSANSGAEFNGGKGKLFEKIFVDQTEFLAGEPTGK